MDASDNSQSEMRVRSVPSKCDRSHVGELWEYLPEKDSWVQLPPHPGFSRWAPGSFVIGCDVFFTCGYDRATGILEKDLMKDRLC